MWDSPKVSLRYIAEAVVHVAREFGLGATREGEDTLRLAVRLVYSECVSSSNRDSWAHVSAILRRRGVERLGTEQEGHTSCQVDSEWSSGAPSRSRMARKLCVGCWHSAHDEIEVTE